MGNVDRNRNKKYCPSSLGNSGQWWWSSYGGRNSVIAAMINVMQSQGFDSFHANILNNLRLIGTHNTHTHTIRESLRTSTSNNWKYRVTGI